MPGRRAARLGAMTDPERRRAARRARPRDDRVRGHVVHARRGPSRCHPGAVRLLGRGVHSRTQSGDRPPGCAGHRSAGGSTVAAPPRAAPPGTARCRERRQTKGAMHDQRPTDRAHAPPDHRRVAGGVHDHDRRHRRRRGRRLLHPQADPRRRRRRRRRQHRRRRPLRWHRSTHRRRRPADAHRRRRPRRPADVKTGATVEVANASSSAASPAS